MNIRDLKYLLAVAETRHFGRAAQKCCVSQPTLSMQIKKLEAELGVSLFERDNKSVYVTEVGQKLAQQARVVIDELEKLQHIAQQAKDPLSGIFSLGIIPTIAPYYLPTLLPALKKSLPNIQLIVSENKTEAILSELRTGLLDAVILATPVPSDGLSSFHLCEEAFHLALPKQHRLSKQANITANDLEHEPLLLLEEGHCLRDQALAFCETHRYKPPTGFSATSLETLQHLVASGAGVTLLPQMVGKKRLPNVLLKPFHDPVPVRQVEMLWRRSTARETCCQKMAAAFQAALLSHQFA